MNLRLHLLSEVLSLPLGRERKWNQRWVVTYLKLHSKQVAESFTTQIIFVSAAVGQVKSFRKGIS